MGKNHDRAYRALKEVARRDGVTPEIVIKKIDEAIYEAYSRACISNDRAVLDAWSQIPCEGKLPTALEFVEYCSSVVENKCR